MTKNGSFIAGVVLAGILMVGMGTARAGDDDHSSACRGLPSHAALRTALQGAQSQANGGFGFQMWATVVNRDGVVCAVAFTGGDRGDQWPGSRAISAQKANTANAFSLPELALSTANLYSAVQPGGTLYGLQASNPVDTDVAYGGNPAQNGRDNDPMVGNRIGGVNVFAGGLALYNAEGRLVGALGVSGDSSCADHNIAWRTRNALNLDYVPAGVSGDPNRKDNIVYDITPQPGQMPGVSASGWGHPVCSAAATAIAAALPPTK
ncbi:MAG TPA: heme-binding protein [Vicinamibacterales bacterium]|nr:heme-binding protein [Vicinamibacterales bacterium]